MTDLYTVNKLNGWEPDQYSGAELEVKDFNLLDNTALNVLGHVKNKVDKYGSTYSSATVIEQNPQIFSWLDLMDLNVWIILALMISVAGVTMISGLLIIILERTQMIGLMEGDRSKKSADKTCFPVVCHFHYRKRINNRKYSRYRSHIAATIYRAI